MNVIELLSRDEIKRISANPQSAAEKVLAWVMRYGYAAQVRGEKSIRYYGEFGTPDCYEIGPSPTQQSIIDILRSAGYRTHIMSAEQDGRIHYWLNVSWL